MKTSNAVNDYINRRSQELPAEIRSAFPGEGENLSEEIMRQFRGIAYSIASLGLPVRMDGGSEGQLLLSVVDDNNTLDLTFTPDGKIVVVGSNFMADISDGIETSVQQGGIKRCRSFVQELFERPMSERMQKLLFKPKSQTTVAS